MSLYNEKKTIWMSNQANINCKAVSLIAPESEAKYDVSWLQSPSTVRLLPMPAERLAKMSIILLSRALIEQKIKSNTAPSVGRCPRRRHDLTFFARLTVGKRDNSVTWNKLKCHVTGNVATLLCESTANTLPTSTCVKPLRSISTSISYLYF